MSVSSSCKAAFCHQSVVAPILGSQDPEEPGNIGYKLWFKLVPTSGVDAYNIDIVCASVGVEGGESSDDSFLCLQLLPTTQRHALEREESRGTSRLPVPSQFDSKVERFTKKVNNK